MTNRDSRPQPPSDIDFSSQQKPGQSEAPKNPETKASKAPVPPQGSATEANQTPVPPQGPVTGASQDPQQPQAPAGAPSQSPTYASAQQPQGQPPKKKRGLIIGLSIAAAVIVLAIAVPNIISMVQVSSAQASFNQAQEAYSSGDYKNAADIYSKTAQMPGADNLREECATQMLACASSLVSAGQYNEALETLSSISTDDEQLKTAIEGSTQLAMGMQALQDGDASLATVYLEEAQRIAGSSTTIDDAQKQASYQIAQSLFEAKEYASAQSSFEQAGDYQDAAAKATQCKNIVALQDANKSYNAGDLRAAQSAYKKLPSNFSHEGVSVKKRLATLKKFKKFVDICGAYSAFSQSLQVKKYSSTQMRGWKGTGYGLAKVKVTCKISGKKVRVRVSWSSNRIKKYATSSSSLKTKKIKGSKTRTFKKLPKSFGVGNHATISFPKKKKAKLSYSMRSGSNEFTSTATLKRY